MKMLTKLFQINQVILIFLFSEFIINIGSAVVAPIFAIFIIKDINAPVAVVGFAMAIYWIVKSILQLPIAHYLDKNHGEIDDFYSMMSGAVITILTFYAYYFINSVWQIYLLQFIMAIGQAFYIPAYLAIFTRHLDKNQEASEWALYSSFSVGIGSALGSLFSGILAAVIGTRSLFLINGTLTLIGFIILIFLKPYIKPHVPKEDTKLIEIKK